ncbi:MAG: hypothetical protein M1829_004885 [Trizodia sp. TS-e1964]|nr:MAG: hypothetical protein M1829_004885 [Trizodia sp. TS-e1964]
MARLLISFVVNILPDQVGYGITAATAQSENAASITPSVTSGARDAVAATVLQATNFTTDGSPLTGLHGFTSFGSFVAIISYVTSGWVVWYFMMAIIFNRTRVFTSSRYKLYLKWPVRLLLRITPIILLLFNIHLLLQNIRCQTSPDFALMRYGNATATIPSYDHAMPGGFLHRFSSLLIFWESDKDCCLSSNMIPRNLDPPASQKLMPLNGSLSTLWPLFQTFSLSQFVDVFSRAIQGRLPRAELSLTLFEHALVFGEAEVLAIRDTGWSPFRLTYASKLLNEGGVEPRADSHKIAPFSKSNMLRRFNTTPEILLVAFISSMSHLTSSVLGIFDVQLHYQLLTSSIWGMSFIASFLWVYFSSSPGEPAGMGLTRFPTVCILGMLPHALLLCGIFICVGIYCLAFLVSVISPPPGLPQPSSLWEKLVAAYKNLQYSLQVSDTLTRITRRKDFFDTMHFIGLRLLIAASEAVYFSEGNKIKVRNWTWLEEERMKELEILMVQNASSKKNLAAGLWRGPGSMSNNLQTSRWISGYAKERKTENFAKCPDAHQAEGSIHPLDVHEKGRRWLMVWGFVQGIFWLVVSWCLVNYIKLLHRFGIIWQPRVLEKIPGWHKMWPAQQDKAPQAPDTLDFWLLSDEGVLSLPVDENVDVEAEMRRRSSLGAADNHTIENFDDTLYTWWLNGGWWGTIDTSGDYHPDHLEDDDEDTTSVISESTTDSNDENSGPETPTQESVKAARSRSGTSSPPDFAAPINSRALARLLEQKTPSARYDAQLLSAHLLSPYALTRSRFRSEAKAKRLHVLTSSVHRPCSLPAFPAPLTSAEEVELLEYLIINRRNSWNSRRLTPDGQATPIWRTGSATGLGPPCVVCQSSQRTILMWPCRCLSLCEDCRVQLAMNNFSSCVCCRREVIAFSRLFVP